jgi:uncharacterized protein YprB with RNaseH-like and TPR domain
MASRTSTRKKLERLRRTPERKADAPAPPTTTPGPGSTGNESLERLERELLGEEAAQENTLSVKERLERLVELTARTRTGRLYEREDGEHQIVALGEVLNGRSVANDRGQYYQVDHEFPLDHWHGKVPLSRLTAASLSNVTFLARGAGELDLARTVFLDTETTGLAGGSGTCAFLVGVGYIEDDIFRVRQFFMRDFNEEEAMLHELSELLSRFRSLVTFNGKSFDVPLLEARYILSRLRFPLSEAPHLDLLHPARNLWKARLESCRLTELEYALLGHEREDDVPGELIPNLYFDYVRSKNASRIHKVFTHNCCDILSLAALTVRALEMLDEGASSEHPLDDYSLGRIFELASEPERSIKYYSRAVESGVRGAARRRALRQWAAQHKRRGEVTEAMTLWKELAFEEGPEAIHALEELARVLEHRDHDFSGALDYCQRALSKIEEDIRLPLSFRQRHRDAFLHRRRRLERKIGMRRRM